jgi:FtsH-binding integral membrane protein
MNQVMMGQQAQGIAIHSGLDQHLENKDDPITDLNDEMVRNGFIRKVYSILSLQLLITTLFCAYGMTH